MKRVSASLRSARVWRQGFVSLLATAFTLTLVWSQDVLVLNFPQTEHGENPPVGLSDWPKENSEGLVSISIPLLSLNDDGCLLVTVMFEDAEDRIVLAKWQGADGSATVLAPNLSDGVTGWNQRTFKVPYENLQTNGTLLLETDAEIQPIKRVVLAWTWPTGVYMAPGGSAVKVVQDAERLYTDKDLNEGEDGPLPDSWSAGIWRAFLQEKIEPLSETTAFSVSFDTVPRAVVFRSRLFGFPMEEAPSLWVNGQKVALVSMEIPGLGRPGYFKTEQGRMRFAGWRKMEAILPADVFNIGENSIVLSGRKDSFINEAMLELSFEDEGSPLVLEKTGLEKKSPPSSALISSPQPVRAEVSPLEPTVVVTPPAPNRNL